MALIDSMTEAEIDSLLDRYDQTEPKLQRRIACEFMLRTTRAEALLDSAQAELYKLAKFKAYVHQRLDEAGIPADPDSPHKADGCRIGGRLDIVLGAIAEVAKLRAEVQFYVDGKPHIDAEHSRVIAMYDDVADENRHLIRVARAANAFVNTDQALDGTSTYIERERSLVASLAALRPGILE